jgi:hypothetical protein
MIKVAEDISDKLGNALEAAHANYFAGDFAEETLDQIKPRAGGWGEVQMEAFPAGEPRFYLRMLVRGIIVANDVDVLNCGDGSIDFFQEGQPLVVAVSRGSMSENLAAEVIQGRKEGYRAVPIVVVGARADVPLPKGKPVWVRSRAWHWLFSSQHSTTAFRGGLR